jgi:hypothetical protein
MEVRAARLIIASAIAAVLAVAMCGCSQPSYSPPESSSIGAQPTGWQVYANTNGDSSVAAYKIGADYVQVRFTDGSEYLYTYASAGHSNIERMKVLAQQGDGLNSFIMSNVRKKYESKQP